MTAPVFGVDRLLEHDAETAPAWPSLQRVSNARERAYCQSIKRMEGLRNTLVIRPHEHVFLGSDVWGNVVPADVCWYCKARKDGSA